MTVHFSKIDGKSGDLGIILLDRPQALNALNLAMCQAIHDQLHAWQRDSTIKGVVIASTSPRSFCAGGDVRAIYHYHKAHDLIAAENFFRAEYRMNAAIFHFTKPYIAFLEGITMGGGAGISLQGSHRVATENLIFAMPETSIGLYPDVGTAYYLSRLPDHIGLFLGLTGERIDALVANALHLVTHVVMSDKKDEIIAAFAETPFGPGNTAISSVLDTFVLPTSQKTPSFFSHRDEIKQAFSADSVEAIVERLAKINTPWCSQIVALLMTKSPTSLKVTFAHIRAAASLSFDAVIQMDFNLTRQFLKAPDFFEGVRAQLIDKDKNPQWQPATLAEVTDAQLQRYFAKNPGMAL